MNKQGVSKVFSKKKNKKVVPKVFSKKKNMRFYINNIFLNKNQ